MKVSKRPANVDLCAERRLYWYRAEMAATYVHKAPRGPSPAPTPANARSHEEVPV